LSSENRPLVPSAGNKESELTPMTTENAKMDMSKGAINLDLSISKLYYVKSMFMLYFWLHYMFFVLKTSLKIKEVRITRFYSRWKVLCFVDLET
jgi:hypothetical protein